MRQYNVAVVGATGLVGETMIRVLEERKFPVKKLLPLASADSLGKKVKFRGEEINVEVLSKKSFGEIDFALFSAGASVSMEYAPAASESGAIVIDNTSAFRMDKDIPLIVPEVNAHVIKGFKKGIIANPNCSTIQLVCVLKPIHDRARIKRVVVSTYQSVSGAGREAIEELLQQVKGDKKREVFSAQIAFNCIPHIDKFEKNGYTKEEMKVVLETKKIMGDELIAVTCTAVRVPVKVSHSESVNIETEKKLTVNDVVALLSKAPNIIVINDFEKYPLALDAEGKNEVFVGRIREDASIANGIDCWIVADNLRKGAATNAVQIAELLI
ncbi:MAG: aspartate-semialdehyde dehydrogenase [Deltaproteobacteria bacterium]|nr:aspartate-semialdehyde dehydrogenase [Deltaproteobacteria bacterium]